MRLSPCVLVQPDGWARGEREGYGGPCDVTSLSLSVGGGVRGPDVTSLSPEQSSIVFRPLVLAQQQEERKHHLLRSRHELRLFDDPPPIHLEPQLGPQALLQRRPRYCIRVRRRLAERRPDVADAARHGFE